MIVDAIRQFRQNCAAWWDETTKVMEMVKREHLAALAKLPSDNFDHVSELRTQGKQWVDVAKIMKRDYGVDRSPDSWKTWYSKEKKRRDAKPT
jgi:hypothetical protein